MLTRERRSRHSTGALRGRTRSAVRACAGQSKSSDCRPYGYAADKVTIVPAEATVVIDVISVQPSTRHTHVPDPDRIQLTWLFAAHDRRRKGERCAAIP